MQTNNSFAIDINGIDVILFQELSIPDVETNTLTYGTYANVPDTKIAGKKKVAQITLKKLRFNELAGVDNWARTWFETTVSGLPQLYWRSFTIREINPLGITVATYAVINAYPQKIAHGGFKRNGDNELVMEDVTLEVNDFKQVL
jgi:phage tail-like protein